MKNLKLILLTATAVILSHLSFAQTQTNPPSQNSNTNDKVFTIVNEMPVFPGGQSYLMEWLSTEIKYPRKARKKKIEGTVYVQFIVEEDGSLSNIKALRDIGYKCGKKAVKAISKMPKWIPGKQNGKPVRVQFNLPVKYKLEGH